MLKRLVQMQSNVGGWCSQQCAKFAHRSGIRSWPVVVVEVQLRSWTAAEGGFKLWNQPNQMQFQPKEQIQTKGNGAKNEFSLNLQERNKEMYQQESFEKKTDKLIYQKLFEHTLRKFQLPTGKAEINSIRKIILS